MKAANHAGCGGLQTNHVPPLQKSSLTMFEKYSERKLCILQCWLKKWLRTNYVSARCLRKLIPSQVTNCISLGCAYFPHSFTNQSLVRAVSLSQPTNHNYFITRICTPAAWYPSNYKLEDFVSFLSAMTNYNWEFLWTKNVFMSEWMIFESSLCNFCVISVRVFSEWSLSVLWVISEWPLSVLWVFSEWVCSKCALCGLTLSMLRGF